MCFIGHGAFGLITKQIWCNYFAVFGIGEHLAYQLMPVVGTVDILLGVSLIIFPLRLTVAWLVVWGLFTALLRPLSGEPFAEFIERAGNFGTPAALLILSNGFAIGWDKLLSRISLASVPASTQVRARKWLQCFAFLLLIGHGWLHLIEKHSLVIQYASLGFGDPHLICRFVGVSEVLGAFIILFKPVGPVILVLVVWKMASELLYPQYELFEWIERGGSYAVLIALWLLSRQTSRESLAKNPSPDLKMQFN